MEKGTVVESGHPNLLLQVSKEYFRITFCSDLICNKILMARNS